MKKLLLVIAAALCPAIAYAERVEGAWPQEARGASFARPDWVLVIPATRLEDGNLLVWDRSDAWVRQWIVPAKTPKGLRTVAIVGDSEDKRTVAAAQIDNMQSSALRQIARKYNAPAVVLAVSGSDGQVVAAWMPGFNATWDYSTGNASDRKGSLETIDALFSGKRQLVSEFTTETAAISASVEVVAERMNQASGTMEYRIKSESDEVLDALSGSPHLVVLGRVPDEPSVIEVRMRDLTPIEAALKSAGLSLR